VREAQRVLTDLGHDSTVRDDGVALALPDRIVGLDNLARIVSRLPRKRWARAVRDQLSVLVRVDLTASIAPEDLRPKLRAARYHLPHPLEYEPLEPLPGVVAVIAAQGDQMVIEMGKLDGVGERDTAYDTALTNLAQLRLPRHTRRRVDPRVPTSWVEFLDSPDSFGASRVMVLPDLVRRVLRQGFPAHGVLVAVPTKHELWVHVPVDESVLETALAMSWLSFETWSQEPYPISPDVFLMSPDMHATRLVMPDHDGVDVDPHALAGLLDALRTAPDGRAAS
jgi:hypothetical protein